jgi:hypothetical protein
MKFSLAVAAVLLAGGIVDGQDVSRSYEHLKSYDQLIGTWEHKGTLGEALPKVVEALPEVLDEDDTYAVHVSYEWILDKNAIECVHFSEIKDKWSMTVKSLIGWDTANSQIVSHAFNSRGGGGNGLETYDDAKKTWMAKNSFAGADRKQGSFTGVLTLIDKDIITSQNLDRKGGAWEGDGVAITLTRVKPKE